jgi:hypothetical protein
MQPGVGLAACLAAPRHTNRHAAIATPPPYLQRALALGAAVAPQYMMKHFTQEQTSHR